MLQSAVNNMQKDIYALKRELAEETENNSHGDQLIPGYTTLTYSDYNDIYEMLKREFLEELNEKAKKG